MKLKLLFFIVLISIVLSGCTSTFLGSVFVFSFSDIISYVAFAFFFGIFIGFKKDGNFKRNFWIWFLISLLLTPLTGFIYLLFLFSKKSA